MKPPSNSLINYAGIGSDENNRLAPMTQWIMDHSHIFKGKTVLDLGSNAGHFPMVFLDAGARFVTAVEPRKVFCRFFNEELCWRHNGNRVMWVVSKVESFEPIGEFDLVSCLGLVYHMKDGWTHLKRIVDQSNSKSVLLDTMLFKKHGYTFETGRHNENCVGLFKIIERPTKQSVESKLDEFGWKHTLVLENWLNNSIDRGMWFAQK